MKFFSSLFSSAPATEEQKALDKIEGQYKKTVMACDKACKQLNDFKELDTPYQLQHCESCMQMAFVGMQEIMKTQNEIAKALDLKPDQDMKAKILKSLDTVTEKKLQLSAIVLDEKVQSAVGAHFVFERTLNSLARNAPSNQCVQRTLADMKKFKGIIKSTDALALLLKEQLCVKDAKKTIATTDEPLFYAVTLVSDRNGFSLNKSQNS